MVRTIRRTYFGVSALLATMALLCMLAGSSGAAAGDTTRVSVDSFGTQTIGDHSVGSATSADGRYVAFRSGATNLVAGDTNGASDIFVRDLQAGTTERVSVDSSGTQGNNSSSSPSVSADGRYVAFGSTASNLVAGDTNGTSDVFVRDLQAGTTERVSVDSSGTQGNNFSSTSSTASISADGRYVAFASNASNLVAGDTNGRSDTFVRDLQAGTTERVSVASSGIQGNNNSGGGAVISSDGHHVAFSSFASNLVAGDTNGISDVFVRDLQAGTTKRVSIASSGTQGVANGSSEPSISADGRYVAFSSAAELVAGDTNRASDIFVRDLQAGTTERVSVNGCSNPAQGNDFSSSSSISADGHYVAFYSDASNLVDNDTNDTSDVFVRDLQAGTTQRVSVASSGTQGNISSVLPSISADGRYVSFSSTASNLVAGDTNNLADVFLHERHTIATPPSDCIAPTTTARPVLDTGGAYEPDKWTNGSVTLFLDAEDNEGGSGVRDIRYSATGAVNIDERVYDPDFDVPSVSTEGTTTISYFATDNMGNQESPAKTLTVKIDRTPPEVSSTSPSNNATGVAATDNISATFSESGSGMDLGTFSSSTFQVVQLKPTGNVPVSSGTFTLNEGSQTVTFDPASSLAKGAYRVTITGVKDKAGNALAEAHTWQFATAGPSKR